MLQKMMIKKCNAVGKPVITATQMMDSMISSPVPTRAEVSDISNAILDGTDAIMLSEETAMGKYPVKAISMMNTIALEVEKDLKYEKYVERHYIYHLNNFIPVEDAVTRYTAKTALDVKAKAIIALTETGGTARMISRYRVKQPIFVFSPSETTLRQTNLSFDAQVGMKADFMKVTEAIDGAREWLKKNKLAKKGDLVVLVAGMPFKTVGGTNTMTVFKV